jgi:hypothetical protein
MPLDTGVVLAQIHSVLDSYERLAAVAKYSDLSDLPDSDVAEILQRMMGVIERLAPPGTSYASNARAIQVQFNTGHGPAAKYIVGILRALRSDYLDGYLQSVTELIHADIFSDFLEMAEYLQAQGYKDAAAVIVGSVLEEHIRKLSLKHGIAIAQPGGAPKKANLLNSELAAATAYSKLDQKNVTAWLDLRNKAAHGNYDEYTREQVALLVQSVRDFLVRHAA